MTTCWILIMEVSKSTIFYLALVAFVSNFGFTFQLSNLTTVFKLSGANDNILPLLWLIPPVTGMLIQPIIGYLSDKTTTSMGRRKPYIIGWGVLAGISFILLPLNHSLIYVLFFTFFIDCSLNGGAECLRALTADQFQNEGPRSQAFSAEAFFAGIGGVLGAYLPIAVQRIFMGEQNQSFFNFMPKNLGISYVFSGLTFLFIIFIFFHKINEEPIRLPKINFSLLFKTLFNFFHGLKNIKTELKVDKIFFQILSIHGISWMGIFIFWLYFSLCIAQENYHLPYMDTGNSYKALHLASLDSSYYFSLYQYVSLIFTLFIFICSRLLKAEKIHGIALLAGAVGMCLISFKTTVLSLCLASICIGIMWGSLIVIPYVVLLNFLPKENVGTCLGLFNMSITLPQVIGALLLPQLYKTVLQAHASYALFLAGLLLLLSCVLWFRLFYMQNPRKILNVSTINH
nr:MFS transporter [Legionella jordanis]